MLRPGGGRVVLVDVTFAERLRHRLPELLYGRRLPLTSNCRAIRVAPLLVELGFVNVTRRYVSQIGLPQRGRVGHQGAVRSDLGVDDGEGRGDANCVPRPSAPS